MRFPNFSNLKQEAWRPPPQCALGIGVVISAGSRCLSLQHPETCGRLPHHPSRPPSPSGACPAKAKQFGCLLFWGGWGKELQLSKTRLDPPLSCSSGTVRMRFWGWTRPPPSLSQVGQEDQELLQKHETPGFGIRDYQAASLVSLSPLSRMSVMVMEAEPFGATLWAPTGPMAGHLPSTAGRATCRQSQCWTLHPYSGSQGGIHRAPWRTDVLMPLSFINQSVLPASSAQQGRP